MEGNIYKIKMMVEWTDRVKGDGVVHKAGEILETNDIERVNDIISRRIGQLVGCTHAPKPEDDSPKVVSFEGKEYPLESLKAALVAIGEKLQGNIGAAGLAKRIEALDEEKATALRNELNKLHSDDEGRV